MFKEFWNKHFKGDPTIWVVFFLLLVISIIEVYSATSSLVYGKVFRGNYNAPIIKHIGFCLGGAFVAFIIHHFDARRLNWFLTFVGWPVAMCLVVSASFSGISTNGAARWSSMPLIGQFQPTEILKLTYVIAVAYCFSAFHYKEKRKKLWIWLMTLTVSTSAVIFKENFSNSLIIWAVWFVIVVLFYNNWKLFILGVGALLLLAFGGIKFAQTESFKSMMGSDVARLGTATARLYRFANEVEPGEPDFNITDNFQAVHGKIAIANSNGIGLLPGRSKERDYLPQAYSDYIYAIIVEETGIFGGFLVVILYLVLLFRVGSIIARSQSMYSTIMAAGLGFMLIFQALINTYVAVGLMPVTGQPLPLVSRGGTSIFVVSMYIGILLSISRFNCGENQEEESGNNIKDNENAEAPTPA